MYNMYIHGTMVYENHLLYLHENQKKNQPSHVGKYTVRPMDSMGLVS